jgi:hypothetical protein
VGICSKCGKENIANYSITVFGPNEGDWDRIPIHYCGSDPRILRDLEVIEGLSRELRKENYDPRTSA